MDLGQEALEPGGEKRLGDPEFVGFIHVLDFWVFGGSVRSGWPAGFESGSSGSSV